MRLLLDQDVPGPLARLLTGHEVVRAAQMGWGELGNGALLAAAEASGFAAMVTSDQNIRYQQNLAGRRIALVVLPTNNWPLLRDHAAAVLNAVEAARPGSYEAVLLPRPVLLRNPPPGAPG